MTSSYHSNSNGTIERVDHIMVQMLAVDISKRPVS